MTDPPSADPPSARPPIAVVHAAPGGVKGAHWGDTHFAAALVDAFEDDGRGATALSRYDWEQAEDAEAVVVLRGLRRFDPPAEARSVLWVISHADAVEDDELAAFDHVCVASSLVADRFRARTATPVHVLHQATDLRRFRPQGMRADVGASGVVVVANARWPARRGPRWLAELGIPFGLYGANWQDTSEAPHVVATQVPNDAVGGIYATAALVVADQWDEMARDGFVANRLFDVAAAGGFVVSDAGVGVTEVFGDLVPTYDSRDSLGVAVRRWLEDPVGRAQRAAELCELVRAQHGFGDRVRFLAELLSD